MAGVRSGVSNPTSLHPGQTYAPLWTVACEHPRCSWFRDGLKPSELEDLWETHDEQEHGDD